jgi:acyl carrier protein
MNKTEEIFEAVVEVINVLIAPPKEKLKMSALLRDDLGADSLDSLEIVMAIEDKFNIRIAEENAENIRTVGDLVKFIQSEKEKNQEEAIPN